MLIWRQLRLLLSVIKKRVSQRRNGFRYLSDIEKRLLKTKGGDK